LLLPGLPLTRLAGPGDLKLFQIGKTPLPIERYDMPSQVHPVVVLAHQTLFCALDMNVNFAGR
jgi:hypothetical protein